MQALFETSNLTDQRPSRKSIKLEHQFEDRDEFSQSRKKQLSIIEKKLRVHGFIHSEGFPPALRKVGGDPLYIETPPRQFRSVGVNSGQRGGRKFSSITLFGRRMLYESYFVSDWERFSYFMGMKLELMFRATNPNPPRQLKLAFTRFMHNFGFHWTLCVHTTGNCPVT